MCKLRLTRLPKKWQGCHVESLPSGEDKSFNPPQSKAPKPWSLQTLNGIKIYSHSWENWNSCEVKHLLPSCHVFLCHCGIYICNNACHSMYIRQRWEWDRIGISCYPIILQDCGVTFDTGSNVFNIQSLFLDISHILLLLSCGLFLNFMDGSEVMMTLSSLCHMFLNSYIMYLVYSVLC